MSKETKCEKYTFDIISQKTPDYLAAITTDILTMLVHNLEDLDHPNLKDTVRAYDYPTYNEEKLARYKMGRLTERMTRENYTFFLLKNEQQQVIALMSGDANIHEKKLDMTNITVHRDHRKQGLVVELIKRISHFAHEQGYEEMKIQLSPYALKKGNFEMYQHIAEKLGIQQLVPENREKENASGEVQQVADLILKPRQFIAPEAVKADMPEVLTSPDYSQLTPATKEHH